MASQPPNWRKLDKRAVLVSVIALPLVAWLAWFNLFDASRRAITVTGTIQAKEIQLSSKVGGRIAKVLVAEGQVVAAGQPLVEFSLPELTARRDQILSQIEQSEARLTEFRRGARVQEIEKARAAASQAYAHWQMCLRGYREEDVEKAHALRREAERALALLEEGYRKEDVDHARELMEQARVNADWARRDWQRFQKLSAEGAVSARDADELRVKLDAADRALNAASEHYRKMAAGPRADEIKTAKEKLNFAIQHEKHMTKGMRSEEVEVARQAYLQAKAALALLEAGTRIEQIKYAEAQVKQNKALLAEVEAQLAERVIASPAAAEVSVMDLHAGEVVSANRPLLTLTRLDMLWTRVYLPERELARVRVGQEVVVRVDAYPKRTFKGRIVQIPGVAEFTPRNVQTPEERSAQVFGLKVNIDNSERLLRGGMNAEVILPPAEVQFRKVAEGAK